MKKHMTELNKLKPAELHAQLSTLSAEIVELRRGVILGDVQNNQLATQKRRQIARIKMMLASATAAATSEVSKTEATTKGLPKKSPVKEKK